MYIVLYSPPERRGEFFQDIWEGFPVVEVRKEENRKGKGKREIFSSHLGRFSSCKEVRKEENRKGKGKRE